MTKHNWKPGDVAMVTDWTGEPRVALVRRRPGHATKALEFVYHDGVDTVDEARAHRPLVVIDPEDREQVERLWSLIDAAEDETLDDITLDSDRWARDAVQAALREFANPTPPRPDEPALWGVVEAHVDGIPRRRWVHHEEDRWVCDTGEWRYWEDLQEPVVVREGVQP